jgi:hypothetical protein
LLPLHYLFHGDLHLGVDVVLLCPDAAFVIVEALVDPEEGLLDNSKYSLRLVEIIDEIDVLSGEEVVFSLCLVNLRSFYPYLLEYFLNLNLNFLLLDNRFLLLVLNFGPELSRLHLDVHAGVGTVRNR